MKTREALISEIENGEYEDPLSRRSKFYDRFYPGTNPSDWSDWKWQMKNRITTATELKRLVDLNESEASILLSKDGNLPLAITPYYASLMDLSNHEDPIRKCVIPRIEEASEAECESCDPLGEDHQSPVKCIVHRYPDRVLFLATSFCAVNCRFCTRSRVVSQEDDFHLGREEWEKGFSYIREHKEIRDVLVSGGDPLTMKIENLEFILSSIRSIEHVEIIRIGTKVPVVIPQKITPELVNMIRKYHPVLISIHFTHPCELTEETSEACIRLADAGMPLGSQTVLLKGVNDDLETMRKLFTGLLKIRVKPYYMYACDLVSGSSHFRTSVWKGLEIIKGLRGHTSGYAIPSFIVDAPNGGGKIQLLPLNVKGFDDKGNVILKNYLEQDCLYPGD
jgi:lysine 2,3-aminomutase